MRGNTQVRVFAVLLCCAATIPCCFNATPADDLGSSERLDAEVDANIRDGTPAFFKDAGGKDTGVLQVGADTTKDVAKDAVKDAAKPLDTGAKVFPYPAPHPAAPQLLKGPGNVMAHPKILPIFFANDSLQKPLTQFSQAIGLSQYWTDTTGEYGVGTATAENPIVLAQAASATTSSADIRYWLTQQVAKGTLPTVDEDRIYLLYFPATTKIQMGGGFSCLSFGAYHSSIAQVGKLPLRFAVVPRCENADSVLDVTTRSTAHELIEIVTDPDPAEKTYAYALIDAPNRHWAALGWENADLCELASHTSMNAGNSVFSVVRTWSNKAAAAGHDPCVPAPEGVYFNAVPLVSEIAKGESSPGGQFFGPGLKLQVGQSQMVDITLFSDGPTDGDWDVQAWDASSWLTDSDSDLLELDLDHNFGSNGDKLRLTVKALGKSQMHCGVYFLFSSNGLSTNFWLGMVEID